MRATINQVQKRNYTWIIVLILIIGPVVLELTLGDRLYNATHDDIVKAQEFSSKNLKLEVFDNSKDKPDYTSPISDIFISEFLHAINSNAFYILLCAFLYNFMNVYKIFLLYMTIFLSNLLSSVLSYLFQFPKPYMAFYKVKSVVFFNEWGSPNNQLVLLVAFSGTFYKTLVANKLCEKKRWIKIIVILVILLYWFFDGFFLFAAGNLTYNQVILSTCLAVAIFLFIFYCFPVDLNKPKQFYDFMKFNVYYWIVINLLILTFQVLLSKFITDKRDSEYYDKNLEIQAGRLPQNDFARDYLKYRTKFSLNVGNFCNVGSFLMNIIAFLSVKADIKFNYKNSYNNWSEGNFEIPKLGGGIVDGDQSGMIEYNIIEQTQWNHNNCGIVVIRTIIDVIINVLIFILFIWLSHYSENEIVLFIFLIALPLILSIFGNLFFFKALYMAIKLATKPKTEMKNLLY